MSNKTLWSVSLDDDDWDYDEMVESCVWAEAACEACAYRGCGLGPLARRMTGWGTPPEIALYTGRPLKTIRNWATSGAIPSACRVSDGALVIHAESARRHSDACGRRNRRLSRIA